mgnify:CR=1 FL=1
MPQIAPLRLTHAQTLLDGALQDHPLTVAEGQITDTPARELDLSGYLLLPGIIDLHGDGFERHLAPRPSAPFDQTKALASAAAELAVNGITTAWFAQSWSWEGGHRSGAAAVGLMAAMAATRPSLLPDVRLQLRLETHVVQDHPQVLEAVVRHGVDFVVFNNHLPEAQEMARNRPDRLAQWAAQTKRTGEEMMEIVRAAEAQSPQVPAALGAIADFTLPDVAQGKGAPQCGEEFRRVQAGIDQAMVGAQQLVSPIAGNTAELIVDVGNPAIEVGFAEQGSGIHCLAVFLIHESGPLWLAVVRFDQCATPGRGV